MIERAKELAERVHAKQTRWDGSPYIEHPRRVAESVMNSGYMDEIIAIGWMHDAIEDADDSDVIRSEIKANFNNEVYSALIALTHNKSDTYAQYIKVVGTNVHAICVKIADLKDNLSDLKDGQRKQKYELALMYLEEKLKQYLKGV
jgi:(p)ppGpp synthase/HD superfamily hydrolase